MQEEIAHCAAGVRWLTYLHAQALTAHRKQQHDMNQQMQNVTLAEPCSSSDTSSISSSRPKQSADLALGMLHKSKACHPSEQNDYEACSSTATNGMSVIESAQAAATVMQTTHDGHEAHAASEPEAKGSFPQAAKGTSGRMALHAWQADAVKYATVEQWFHSLVRAHFKGSLKVSLHFDMPNPWLCVQDLVHMRLQLDVPVESDHYPVLSTLWFRSPEGLLKGQANCVMESRQRHLAYASTSAAYSHPWHGWAY